MGAIEIKLQDARQRRIEMEAIQRPYIGAIVDVYARALPILIYNPSKQEIIKCSYSPEVEAQVEYIRKLMLVAQFELEALWLGYGHG